MNKTASEIWGESETVLELKSRLSKAAQLNRPVLIVGERGTGKELAAARIHFLSPRWKKPYLTLNCAALNINLIESELFGYEPGAFTGAAKINPGRFETADGGSLFLDEISHLSAEAQAKILRVVEYGTFQRVGSAKEMKVDVRLVSATNVDLRREAEEGRFLPDLLDRLSFEIIRLPPLRERGSDISLLAHLFAARMAGEMGLKDAPVFSHEALDLLEHYSWPGNVRELKNIVERAVYKTQGRLIEFFDLDFELQGLGIESVNNSLKIKNNFVGDIEENIEFLNWPLNGGEFDELLGTYAGNLIKLALKKAKYNQKEAARLLGLNYHRFRFLKRKYLLDTKI